MVGADGSLRGLQCFGLRHSRAKIFIETPHEDCAHLVIDGPQRGHDRACARCQESPVNPQLLVAHAPTSQLGVTCAESDKINTCDWKARNLIEIDDPVRSVVRSE